MSQPTAPEPPSCERPLLIQALREVLVQGLELTGLLEAGVYSAPPTGLANSGAGPHLRHVMDFCRRWLDGLETGRIDYDRRERDPEEEVDPRRAATSLEFLIGRLDAIRTFDPRQPVEVRHDVPTALIGASDPGGEPWTRSSLGRELLFVLSHTIHHYALMGMALRHLGVDPGPDFGVAPSTLRYWAEAGTAPSGSDVERAPTLGVRA